MDTFQTVEYTRWTLVHCFTFRPCLLPLLLMCLGNKLHLLTINGMFSRAILLIQCLCRSHKNIDCKASLNPSGLCGVENNVQPYSYHPYYILHFMSSLCTRFLVTWGNFDINISTALIQTNCLVFEHELFASGPSTESLLGSSQDYD